MLYQRILLPLLVAMLFSLAAGAQSAHMLWKAKWDVNYFISRKTGFSSDGKYYAIADSKGRVVIYTADSGSIYTAYREHDKQVFCSLFRPYTHTVATADKQGIVKLYDIDTSKTILTMHTGQGALTAMAFSKDGHLLATGGRDNSVKVWNPDNGKLLTEVSGIKGNVICLRITPDNKRIVVGTRALSKGVKVFDMKTGVEHFSIETDNLQNFDLSPDGKFLAIAELSKYLKVFNLDKRQLHFEVRDLDRHLNDVVYDTTGNLISSGEDRTVIYWDWGTMRSMDLVQGKNAINGIAFLPAKGYLAVMDNDGTLSMWHVIRK